jgi:hypothetical protein
MNLNEKTTIYDLGNFISQFDDEAAAHILWVDKSGEVRCHEHRTDDDFTPAGWADHNSNSIQFRIETFSQGNGYVGHAAANDYKWLTKLHLILLKSWEEKKNGYIDAF